MGDLAEALDVSVASATGIVDRMERRGLVERGRGVGDRRVIMVSLTPSGGVVFGGMRAKRRERLAGLVERLSDEERAGFLVGLRAMRVAADEIYGSGGTPSAETAATTADPATTAATHPEGRSESPNA
jgi:DNA-binding MarR family transcriptional regulator